MIKNNNLINNSWIFDKMTQYVPTYLAFYRILWHIAQATWVGNVNILQP